ncbi:MAG: hypothetical protein RR840_10840 [Clostridium sp.]
MYLSLDDVNVIQTNGYIRVYNGAGFFSYFAVSYYQNGERVDRVSPVISLLQSSSIYLPDDASNIMFVVFMAYDVSCWQEIYTQFIDTPAPHCYYESGALWSPKVEEIQCNEAIPEPIIELKNLSEKPGGCRPSFLGGNTTPPSPPMPPCPICPPCPPRPPIRKCCKCCKCCRCRR